MRTQDYNNNIIQFCNGLFVALGETVHFQPWDQFLDFSYPAIFVKKNQLMPQKIFPHPTPCAENDKNIVPVTGARQFMSNY